jgi:hypothetical protein
MATCYLWITLVSPQPVDDLIAGLVNKGWTVGPLASDGKIGLSGTVSEFVALKVDGVEPISPKKGAKESKGSTPQHVLLDATKAILKNALFFSIIAFALGDSFTWAGSNIPAPKKPDTRKTALDRVAGDDTLDDPESQVKPGANGV